MRGLGKTLRERAAFLGLTDSEVARRLGMSQARYHNYVADTAEPDLATLVKICRTLDMSPDQLLGCADRNAEPSADDVQRGRVASALSALEGEALAYAADLVEAVVVVQRKRMVSETVRPRRDGVKSVGMAAAKPKRTLK